MPDDRLFHPRLLQSDKVDRLTDFERGVWLVSRLICDDFGVLRANANTLQGAARFLESKSAKVVQRALVAIDRVGLLTSFDHEGRAYLFQLDWQDFQKVNYPRSTLHPRPPAEMLALCSPSTQELFAKHPGGWGRKKTDTLNNGSENVPKTVPERSENVSPKPLAVSREPLAVSREPDAHTPTDAVQRVIDKHEELHRQYWGIGYIGNPHKDYDAARQFVKAIPDVALQDAVLIYGLNDSSDFMASGNRTVSKIASRALEYVSVLKAKKLVTV